MRLTIAGVSQYGHYIISEVLRDDLNYRVCPFLSGNEKIISTLRGVVTKDCYLPGKNFIGGLLRVVFPWKVKMKIFCS